MFSGMSQLLFLKLATDLSKFLPTLTVNPYLSLFDLAWQIICHAQVIITTSEFQAITVATYLRNRAFSEPHLHISLNKDFTFLWHLILENSADSAFNDGDKRIGLTWLQAINNLSFQETNLIMRGYYDSYYELLNPFINRFVSLQLLLAFNVLDIPIGETNALGLRDFLRSHLPVFLDYRNRILNRKLFSRQDTIYD
jgi:hypothetical protein